MERVGDSEALDKDITSHIKSVRPIGCPFENKPMLLKRRRPCPGSGTRGRARCHDPAPSASREQS